MTGYLTDEDRETLRAAQGRVVPTSALEAAVERILVRHMAAPEALVEQWREWARTRSTPRIDAFRDAAEQLHAAIHDDPSPT
jgi:hypothetical protein